MVKRENKDLEKRKYLRITYNQEERPRLKIGDHTFEVKNLTQMGIGFTNDEEITLGNTIEGLLLFLNGKSLKIEGNVVWNQDDDFVVVFNQPISHETILEQHAKNIEA